MAGSTGNRQSTIANCNSLNPRQPLPPDVVKLHRGAHVAQTILGDLAVAPFGHQAVHVHAGHAVVFGRLDSEGLAVEIEVELARCAVATADAVKSQLLGQIAMRLVGET